MSTLSNENGRRFYSLRFLLCLAGTLLVLIALVWWWPAPEQSPGSDTLYSAHGRDVIQIEEIVATQQRQAPPPPAYIPIEPVPDDVELPDEDLNLTDSFLTVDEPGDDPEYQEGDPEASSAPAASRSARLVRVVEPDYPREAKRRNIQARLVMQLVVNEDGRVDDITIMERYKVNGRNGTEERVARLGYGIEEAALDAARRVQYRPAIQNGEVVSEVTTYTITLGQ